MINAMSGNNTKEEGTLLVVAEEKGNWSIITTSNVLNFCSGPLLLRKSSEIIRVKHVQCTIIQY